MRKRIRATLIASAGLVLSAADVFRGLKNLHGRLGRLALVTGLLAGAVPASTASAAPPVLLVPQQYATIQSAIDAATPGATIVVAPGTYTEQLSINKSLSLRGAGASATTIRAPETLVPVPNVVPHPALGIGEEMSGLVVVGNQADVAISGVSVTGPVPCGAVVGVWATQGANVRLADSTVSDVLASDPVCSNTWAVIFGAHPRIAFDGNPGTYASGEVRHTTVDTFRNAGLLAIAPHGGPATSVTFSDNTVRAGTNAANQGTPAVFVLLNAVAQIRGNTVVGGRCTVAGRCGPDFLEQIQAAAVAVATGVDGTVVTDNVISGSDIGFIGDGTRVKFSGNTVTDNKYVGVAFVDVDARTSKNVISGNPVGILVAALGQDSSLLSSGDQISDYTESATETLVCCGFVATITMN
jgi:hypothetical protein